MTKRPRLLLAAALAGGLAALGPGCASAEYDAEDGDIATAPVEHDHDVVPLTVSVAPFEDRTGLRLKPGQVACWTRSYAKVLERSQVFLDVFPAKARAVRPPADLRIRGSIYAATLERNYAWLSTWGVIAVATLGYGAFIGPVVGLPWATDSVDFAVETRVETAAGKRVAIYRTRFRDKLWLSAYSGEEGVTGYYQDVRVPLQEVCARAVRQVIDDYDVYRALANERGSAARRRFEPEDDGPKPVPVAARPPAPPRALPPAPAPPPPEPPPAPPPAPPPEAPAPPAARAIGRIERIDPTSELIIVKLGGSVRVRTGDVLEVLRGDTRIGKIRVVKVLPETREFSANPDRSQSITDFRVGYEVEASGS